jgi:hypothetical protein
MALNFHSYFSIFAEASATATASEYNPFDEDNYSSYSSTSLSSPDISYDSSTGRVTFGAGGDYFVVFTANCEVSTGNNKTVVLKIKKNGSAVITTDAVILYSNFDPEQVTAHLIVSVEVGDYIEATVDGSVAEFFTSLGTHLTIVKANGHYSSAFYTTKADQTGTADNYDLYDTTNEGGVVSSKLNGVVYAGSTGRFTPSATRTFLMFSSWIYDTGGSVSDLEHQLAIDGSAIDAVTAGASAGLTPLSHTYSLLKEVADDEYATVKRDQGGTTTFDAEVGTSFTMFDISNGGTDPTAMLCFSVTNDSNAFADDSGDKDIFDADNYGTFAKTDHVTAAGITYTQADGKFTLLGAGDYLVICNMVSDSVAAGASTAFKINKNGTTYFTDNVFKHASIDPQSHVVCLIMRLNAGDYLNFLVNNFGADVDDGTSVTIVRLNNIGESNDLFPQLNSDNLLDDDYTINNYSSGTLGRQHDHLATQPQFSLGIPGALNLRRRGPLAQPYTTSKGKSKK